MKSRLTIIQNKFFLANYNWPHVALYVTLSIVVVYPIFSVTVPPLVDYPNHLARIHVLSAWDSVAEIRANDITDLAWRPNMAMDLLLPPLPKIFPVYEIGRAFVATTMLALISGTIALRKVVHGRVGLLPVFAFLIVYSQILFWGFYFSRRRWFCTRINSIGC